MPPKQRTQIMANTDDGRGKCMASCVDEGSLESYWCYFSRRTVLEMLRDRGYDVPDFEFTRSLPHFRSVFGDSPDLDRLRISLSHLSILLKRILVIFCGTEDIRTSTARGIYAQIMDKERLQEITDLLVNITKHALEPKYKILNAEEKQRLLRKWKLRDKQLPRMLGTDAIARYYGLEKGQVVKVTYSYGVVDSLETYRCVV